jgi:2-hydroxychromene-2-carboxylate isomerase
MSEPIRFYFDFVSTYSHFAVHRIEEVAARHGRTVDWRVVSLPHVFKANDAISPLQQPRKFEHNSQDILRIAAMTGIPFTKPEVRPLDARLPRQVFYWLKHSDPRLAKGFACAVMTRYFGEGKEVRTVDQVLEAANGLSITRKMVEQAADDSAAKQALVDMLDMALADGMFGAPYAVVDGQRFWGHDRVIDHMDWWLARFGN